MKSSQEGRKATPALDVLLRFWRFFFAFSSGITEKEKGERTLKQLLFFVALALFGYFMAFFAVTHVASNATDAIDVVFSWNEGMNNYNYPAVKRHLAGNICIPRIGCGESAVFAAVIAAESFSLDVRLKNCVTRRRSVQCDVNERSDFYTAANVPNGAHGTVTLTIEGNVIQEIDESTQLRDTWELALGTFKQWVLYFWPHKHDDIWDEEGCLRVTIIEAVGFLNYANFWIRCNTGLQTQKCPVREDAWEEVEPSTCELEDESSLRSLRELYSIYIRAASFQGRVIL